MTTYAQRETEATATVAPTSKGRHFVRCLVRDWWRAGTGFTCRANSPWNAVHQQRAVQPSFHHARNHYVVDVCNAIIRWLCQCDYALANWRSRCGFPTFEYVVVLDLFIRWHHGFRWVLIAWWRSFIWLDCVRSAF